MCIVAQCFCLLSPMTWKYKVRSNGWKDKTVCVHMCTKLLYIYTGGREYGRQFPMAVKYFKCLQGLCIVSRHAAEQMFPPRVFDMYAEKTLGVFSGNVTVTVASHDIAALKLTPAE
eukprot:m.760493 g.760493  ORF g.760493 m.760493 type:complete len:116 (-) comp23200_c1_seq11:883-1230(-)